LTAAPKPLTSVELRWFLKADHEPAGLNAWIRADWAGAARVRQPQEETRTDSYLVVHAPDVGAKKRGQQQLEVKVRQDAAAPRSFGRHSGRVERWTKWAVDNIAAAALNGDVRSKVEQATERVDVRKTRWLRRLAVHDGAPREIPPDQWVARAIGVELTGIVARGQHWWSVGFEAFPDEEGVRAAFDPIVTRILEPLRTITFATENSMGYPEWLLRKLSVQP
jgi:hypothetical protein